MALTVVDGAMLNTDNAQYTMFKNRLINGDMRIGQRGTSFSSPASISYTLDRWFVGWGGASPTTVSQVTGPTGFRSALRMTGVAGNTVMYIAQRIESINCSDLSGATITLQANIATSVSQTVAWSLAYPNAQDNYSGTTSVASGTWSTTSTATTFTATVSNLASGVTNGLQLIIAPANSGAFTSGTITITGVQIEKGSNATSFDIRPYTTDFQLCQRYYQKFLSTNGAIFRSPGTVTGNIFYWMPFATAMRGTPTMSVGTPIYSNASGASWQNIGADGGEILITVSASGGYAFIPWTASIEL